MTEAPAFQDLYPDHWAHCYGCGRLNEHGLHIRSFWDGDETVATVVPKPHHTAIPGFVYGGFIASVIDCHSTGTAAWAALCASGAEPGTGSHPRFVTAALHVEYLRPTPMGEVLEVRGRIKEMSERKVIVTSILTAGGEVCARGEVVAVRLRDSVIAE